MSAPPASTPTDIRAGVAIRALRMLRREGPRSFAIRAWERGRHLVYLREEHVWYGLDLLASRTRHELPSGVRLIRAGAADTARVAAFGQDPEAARRRHSAGNDLWLALEGDDPLFCCWTFWGIAPVLAAPGGWLELPPDTVCLEDSATSPAARGRGIAPGSWSAIAEILAAEGVTAMITKVTPENTASRRAVTKAGFAEIGVMRLTRLGRRKRTTMEVIAPGLGDELAARLVN